jgi:transposase-like protein
MTFMRVSREEWAKRVERWKDSGLTAKEFASELGVNPRSLVFWKWQLGKAVAKAPRETSAPSRSRSTTTLPLVELSSAPTSSHFELELGGARRLTNPSTFDADALRRLISVLSEAS